MLWGCIYYGKVEFILSINLLQKYYRRMYNQSDTAGLIWMRFLPYTAYRYTVIPNSCLPRK